MGKEHFLSIGGIKIILTSKPEVALLSYPSYQDFTGERGKGNNVLNELGIDLLFGRVPATCGEMLFETNSSWSMLHDADGNYFLRLEDQIAGAPQVIAKFDSLFTNVTLFCSSDLISSAGSAQNPVHYPIDQILLMYYLSMNGGAIVHSAGIVADDRGYIFAGRSGAGKSTIACRLLESAGHSGLSDDRIIVRKTADSFRIFGTPWPGDAGIAVNESARLSGTFFLIKSDKNRVVQITEAEAFRRFMPVLSIPWYDKDVVQEIFSTIEELVLKVPSYILYFTPDIEPAHVFEAITEGKYV